MKNVKENKKSKIKKESKKTEVLGRQETYFFVLCFFLFLDFFFFRSFFSLLYFLCLARQLEFVNPEKEPFRSKGRRHGVGVGRWCGVWGVGCGVGCGVCGVCWWWCVARLGTQKKTLRGGEVRNSKELTFLTCKH